MKNVVRLLIVVCFFFKDIALKCHWNDTKLKCNTALASDDHNFQVSDTLFIELPHVFKRQYGYYKCSPNQRVFSESCFLEESSRTYNFFK